jgi:hypothetical protein
MSTPVVYPQHKLKQFNGAAVIDYDTDDIRVFILSSSYTYSASHAFVSDLTNHVTGTGAPGTSGLSVANKTYVLNGNNGEFAHDDVVIAQNAGGFINGRIVVWAKWTGVAATSPLMMVMTEAADFGNVAGPLTLDGTPSPGVLGVS